MNEEIYEAIERALEKNRIDEDVDDVLLELGEAIQEGGEGSRTVTIKYKKVAVEASGRCEADEEDEEEFYVWIDEIRIGKEVIEIHDYVM